MGVLTKTRKIICQNSYGYKLEFAYSFPFFLESYSGIHEYSGKIATIKSAFGIGVSYIGTSVNSRNITLTIAFRDDEIMQKRKTQIFNIFPLKDNGTLFYYEGDIVRKINYFVEKVSLTNKTGVIYATISLICPSPYFMDSQETIASLNNWNKCLSFKLEIPDGTGIQFGSKNESTSIEVVNDTHINYGLTIVLIANGNVTNPIVKNTSTNEILKLNKSLATGEKIIITTYNNNKTITYVDLQGNEILENNILVFGTKFLQASNGVNKFITDADSGKINLDCSISYYNYYEAV